MDDAMLRKIAKIVDTEFCEKILRKSENDPGIQVTDVLIKPATNKGDNYTSEMFRVNAEFVRAGSNDAEKKTFIVKVEPMDEGVRQDLVSKTSLFSTEIMMMTETLAKMNEVLGGNRPLNGRGLFTQKEDPPLLVIEDLAPLGFRMADRQAGLDMDHCLLAIRGLARFHASSVALCEKEPRQKELYSCGLFNMRQPVEMQSFFIEGTKQLGREIAHWPELDSNYSDKILKLADKMYEKGSAVSVCREDEFNVINHGDFWVNNMLFRYNEKNRPVGHIFVDFQMCVYTSPAIDLLYFFNTSLADDTLLAHEDTLLHEYLRVLSSTMSEVGCKTPPPTMAELKRMLRERALYGMVASFAILPVLLVDKSEAKDLGEIMGAEGDAYDNPAYKGKLYRQTMVRRLPKFDEMGLLD
ncbi:hypothetical protein TSAR_016853 [Trichomalopsis sarcophagae]|uniref:CHK kinase-like domain-containing protein n=1 Tax=Trichomalopsis sarcophagae TaxID=543379 RepID=A0A232F0Q3_9HYME|nr:hypothetical protein TSAR_016853 [Trichomalopsis sarcophagae]